MIISLGRQCKPGVAPTTSGGRASKYRDFAMHQQRPRRKSPGIGAIGTLRSPASLGLPQSLGAAYPCLAADGGMPTAARHWFSASWQPSRVAIRLPRMFGCRPYLFCSLALLAAAPAAVQAQAHGPDFWAVTGVTSSDALNLRVSPNADSRALARIPYNARGLKNLGCPNDVTFERWKLMTQGQRDRAARARWCQVEYKGNKGWVAGRFLREDGGSQK